MNEIGGIIRRLREERGWTQEQLGKKLGVTFATINKYESGVIPNLKQSTIKKLAEIFEVNPSYLFGWVDEAVSPDNFIVANLPKSKIPIIGKVACGTPIDAFENIEGYMDPIQYVHADYCLIAQGDSMINAGIDHGDILYIRKTPVVENGQIAVILIDDQATVKRFYKAKGGFMLIAENQNYEPLYYGPHDPLSIIGQVTHITKSLK